MNNTWVVLLGILIWIGCIEFEKQTMTCRHFPEADTLVIWWQHEGIYGITQKCIGKKARIEIRIVDNTLLLEGHAFL